ncbi:unnamed protein product [Anisakis simplex]|uniref:Chromo domain-containing protein n=1 Tax=Anisakis simplex TaxID=6269 RepID=A0A3P6PQT9_ANISI|nr:unnamed protein product [Anisakis simplex]
MAASESIEPEVADDMEVEEEEEPEGRRSRRGAVVGEDEEDVGEADEDYEDETKSSMGLATTAEATPTPSRESTIALEETRSTTSGSNRRSKRRGGKAPRRSAPPKKKRRDDEEVTDEAEDDDFVPESTKRTRKRLRSKRREKEVESTKDIPIEYVEKRRSGRTLGASKKNYDLQAKWDEMEEELMEEDDGAQSGETKKEEPSEFIIEKIMSVKKDDKGDGPDTYFVKYKNK